MSFKFGSSNNKQQATTQTQQEQKSEPWAPTQPYLQDFLSKLGYASSTNPPGATDKQNQAFDALEAQAGNPFADIIKGLAGTVLDKSPDDAAYADLSRRLSPYANGEKLNLTENPFIAEMLAKNTGDVSNKINSYFAGAGRDLSGKNQEALARGISAVQLPTLAGLYETETGRLMDASKTLFGASGDLGTREINRLIAGVGGADAAVKARDEGQNAILNLEEQRKQLPFSELGWLAQYLLPMASLGGQTSGTSTSNTTGSSKTSGWQAGIDPKTAFQGLGLLGTLF